MGKKKTEKEMKTQDPMDTTNFFFGTSPLACG
jgi:hypothetical protein